MSLCFGPLISGKCISFLISLVGPQMKRLRSSTLCKPPFNFSITFQNILTTEKLKHLSLPCPIPHSPCILRKGKTFSPLIRTNGKSTIQLFHGCHLKQTLGLKKAKSDTGENICRAELSHSFRNRQSAMTTSVSDH